jgi:methyl-accepting chemotaxis protein
MFGLSIRSLLIGLFAMLAVVFAAQGLLSISKISAVNASAVDLADNWLAAIKAVKQINVIVARLRINQARHMVATTDDEMTAIEHDREARIKELAAERKIYEPLMTTEEERRTFAHFADTWEKFQKIHLAMIAATRGHRHDEATSLFRGDAHTMFRTMIADLDKLVAISESGAAEAVHRAAANHATAIWVSVVALGSGLIIAIGAIAFSFWGIARPIGDITGSMSELAAGETETDIPFATRRDEIGRMAAAVQVFKDNMLKARRLEAEAAAAKEENERRRKADMHRLANEFEAAVGGIIGAVSSSATELEASAGTLTKTAEITQERSGSVAAASEEASANVRSVAAATEEITSSVNEIGRQVYESSQIATEAVKQAQQTDSRITQLSQAAGRIGDVVKLITAIAEQTNLLALNATIEAARAGEAGRGFAVVASEVKALAAQTGKATEEIGTQIAGMQAATQESVAAINAIGATITRISQITSAIAAAVEQQGAATQEISRNVQQAASGTEQVAGDITEVNRGASETGSASAQVLASAQGLAGESNHLKIEVEKFLATVRAA